MKTDEKKTISATEAKRLKIVLEKTDTGYSAYAQGTKGIYTAGESLSYNKAQQIEMGLHKLANEFQAVHFS